MVILGMTFIEMSRLAWCEFFLISHRESEYPLLMEFLEREVGPKQDMSNGQTV
jgi:hypothetical protein